MLFARLTDRKFLFALIKYLPICIVIAVCSAYRQNVLVCLNIISYYMYCYCCLLDLLTVGSCLLKQNIYLYVLLLLFVRLTYSAFLYALIKDLPTCIVIVVVRLTDSTFLFALVTYLPICIVIVVCSTY